MLVDRTCHGATRGLGGFGENLALARLCGLGSGDSPGKLWNTGSETI
jgi:hypothetical protein